MFQKRLKCCNHDYVRAVFGPYVKRDIRKQIGCICLRKKNICKGSPTSTRGMEQCRLLVMGQSYLDSWNCVHLLTCRFEMSVL